MNTNRFEEWVEETYRRLVADADAEGRKRLDVEQDIVPIVKADLARGDLVLPDDVIEKLIRSIIERGDNERRRKQPSDMARWSEIVQGLTILGLDDPMLDEVCVIGSGLRKAWRFVDTEDIMAMAQRRVTMAADAASAANEFMIVATRVQSYLLRTFGAGAVIGDLVPKP